MTEDDAKAADDARGVVERHGLELEISEPRQTLIGAASVTLSGGVYLWDGNRLRTGEGWQPGTLDATLRRVLRRFRLR